MNRAATKAVVLLVCCLHLVRVSHAEVTNSITNPNGDVVKLQLGGPGTLTYTLLNGDLGPIDQLTLDNTTTNSTLTIKVKKSSTGTGITDINAIIGAGSLKTLEAKSVNLVGAGLIMGGSIGKLTINNLTNSAITIAGVGVAESELELGQLKCGTLVGSRIQVVGDIGKATVARMIDSDLWAGFIPGDPDDPMAGGSFTNRTEITSVQIKGVKKSDGPAFINSTIAAQTMGKVTLASINTNNLGRVLGVLANTFTNTVTVKSPKFKRAKDGPVSQTLGDFEVRQLFNPVVFTDAALELTDDAAALTGSVNANGLPTFAYFEWGTDVSYGVTTPVELIGRSTNFVTHRAPLTGLTPGTTYHYRIVASNNNGTTTGNDQKFVAGAPVITPDNMALIPAGPFQMGDALEEGSPTELPVHTVNISAFFMDRTEVTKAHYDEVRNWGTANGYEFDKPGYSVGPDHPVGWISWYDCIKWCNARSEMNALTPCYYTDAGQTNVYRTGQEGITNSFVNWNATGYRLPTEAEWEKAARGGQRGLRYPWGSTIAHSQATYYSVDSLPYDISLTRFYNPLYYTGIAPYTSPVGSHLPNGYGLYDMTGNVWEWCWDVNMYLWYSDPSANEPDPVGPDKGKYRSVRGGSWLTTAEFCRVSYRDYFLQPLESIISIGFRTVRRPETPSE